MKKAAIYCRLSEEDKNKLCATDDSGSIQNQKAMLVQYAEEQGWEVYQIYSDDDYTGADRRRPQFKRLLKDAEQYKKVMYLLSNLNNTTRLWLIKGHTPNELSQDEILGKIVPFADVRRQKVGRNDPCPCGSGKKYKNCCLHKDEN